MTELTKRMQTMVEDTTDAVMGLPRRLMLASRGAIAMTRDEAEHLLNRGENLFEKLIDRGEKLESKEQAESEPFLKTWERRSRKQLHQAEEQLEQQIQNVLRALHIPSADDVVQLDEELDRLSAKIDMHLVKLEQAGLPIEGYADMTVREIAPLLDSLDQTNLKMVQVYEKAHANRVTILREIDEKLAA